MLEGSQIKAWVQNLVGTSHDSEYCEDDTLTKRLNPFMGLTISAISTLGCSILFKCSRPLPGALFGVINYLALTSLVKVIEYAYPLKARDHKKAAIAFFSGALITTAALQKICGVSLSYRSIFLLSTSAFAGQLYRLSQYNEEPELF